jgi:predicted phage terminase large subunit-like protein
MPVTGDKSTRAIGFASQLNVGNVKMLAADWNTGLIQRLDLFPTKGIPDDEIDALADAFNNLTTKKPLVVGV